MYSAINNCTTVKQVLDNAATWQRMVKNNLIVYCIEQSDDFMKTLADYPDRLYELVSNKYMQTLMKKSSRSEIKKIPCRSTVPVKLFESSGGVIIGEYIYNLPHSGTTVINITLNYRDGTSETKRLERIERELTSFNLLDFMISKKVLKNIYQNSDANGDLWISYYSLAKPTI